MATPYMTARPTQPHATQRAPMPAPQRYGHETHIAGAARGGAPRVSAPASSSVASTHARAATHMTAPPPPPPSARASSNATLALRHGPPPPPPQPLMPAAARPSASTMPPPARTHGLTHTHSTPAGAAPGHGLQYASNLPSASVAAQPRSLDSSDSALESRQPSMHATARGDGEHRAPAETPADAQSSRGPVTSATAGDTARAADRILSQPARDGQVAELLIGLREEDLIDFTTETIASTAVPVPSASTRMGSVSFSNITTASTSSASGVDAVELLALRQQMQQLEAKSFQHQGEIAFLRDRLQKQGTEHAAAELARMNVLKGAHAAVEAERDKLQKDLQAIRSMNDFHEETARRSQHTIQQLQAQLTQLQAEMQRMATMPAPPARSTMSAAEYASAPSEASLLLPPLEASQAAPQQDVARGPQLVVTASERAVTRQPSPLAVFSPHAASGAAAVSMSVSLSTTVSAYDVATTAATPTVSVAPRRAPPLPTEALASVAASAKALAEESTHRFHRRVFDHLMTHSCPTEMSFLLRRGSAAAVLRRCWHDLQVLWLPPLAMQRLTAVLPLDSALRKAVHWLSGQTSAPDSPLASPRGVSMTREVSVHATTAASSALSPGILRQRQALFGVGLAVPWLTSPVKPLVPPDAQPALAPLDEDLRNACHLTDSALQPPTEHDSDALLAAIQAYLCNRASVSTVTRALVRVLEASAFAECVDADGSGVTHVAMLCSASKCLRELAPYNTGLSSSLPRLIDGAAPVLHIPDQMRQILGFPSGANVAGAASSLGGAEDILGSRALMDAFVQVLTRARRADDRVDLSFHLVAHAVLCAMLAALESTSARNMSELDVAQLIDAVRGALDGAAPLLSSPLSWTARPRGPRPLAHAALAAYAATAAVLEPSERAHAMGDVALSGRAQSKSAQPLQRAASAESNGRVSAASSTEASPEEVGIHSLLVQAYTVQAAAKAVSGIAGAVTQLLHVPSLTPSDASDTAALTAALTGASPCKMIVRLSQMLQTASLVLPVPDATLLCVDEMDAVAAAAAAADPSSLAATETSVLRVRSHRTAASIRLQLYAALLDVQRVGIQHLVDFVRREGSPALLLLSGTFVVTSGASPASAASSLVERNDVTANTENRQKRPRADGAAAAPPQDTWHVSPTELAENPPAATRAGKRTNRSGVASNVVTPIGLPQARSPQKVPTETAATTRLEQERAAVGAVAPPTAQVTTTDMDHLALLPRVATIAARRFQELLVLYSLMPSRRADSDDARLVSRCLESVRTVCIAAVELLRMYPRLVAFLRAHTDIMRCGAAMESSLRLLSECAHALSSIDAAPSGITAFGTDLHAQFNTSS